MHMPIIYLIAAAAEARWPGGDKPSKSSRSL
jgi:hypothetical protein